LFPFYLSPAVLNFAPKFFFIVTTMLTLRKYSFTPPYLAERSIDDTF